MSQERLRNFQHPLLSFEHNKFNMGFHKPGRYMGFDTKVKITGLVFNLTHTGSNLTYTNPNHDTIGPIGVYMTPQGTIIQETGVIGPFTVISNSGNTSVRYDLVYANHDQVEVGGGQDATYVLLKGAIGNPVRPAVPDPEKHTPIGYVVIPANENLDINNCTWEKAKSPDSGDNQDARLDYVNIFTKFQGDNFSILTTGLVPTKNFVDGGVNRQFWELQNDGNTFNLLPSSSFYTIDALRIFEVTPREGFRVFLRINERVGIRTGLTTANTNSGDLTAGWRAVKFTSDFGNSINTNPQIKPDTGKIWEVELLFLGGYWNVVKIAGTGYMGGISGEMKAWPGLLAKVPVGWLVCDGSSQLIADYPNLYENISTTYGGDGVTTFFLPDMKGKVPVGVDPGDVDFDLGDHFGDKEVLLLEANLPAHRHGLPASTAPTPEDVYGITFNLGPSVITNTQFTQNTGLNVPHKNMPPYLTIYWIIKT